MSASTNTCNRWQARLQPPPSPAGAGDSLLAVPTIAALIALDSTLIDDGGVVAVKSLLAEWMLDKTSVDAVDGITVVAANPVGRWYRMFMPVAHWLAQPTWYINPGTGDDENAGATGPTALATHAELMRRISGGAPTTAVTVYLDADITEPIVADWGNNGTGVAVIYEGLRTVLFASTVTGVQAYNPAASVDGQITDAAIPVSWTASGLVGKRIVMTSGAVSGYTGWVIKDLAAKTARFSPFWLTAVWNIGTPAINDDYEVYDVTKVNCFISTGPAEVLVRDVDFIGPGIHSGMCVESLGGQLQLEYCSIDPTAPGYGYAWLAGAGGENYMWACRLAPMSYMFVNSYLLVMLACDVETEIDLSDSLGNVEMNYCVSQYTVAGAFADVTVADAEILGWHAIFDNPAGTDCNYYVGSLSGHFRGTTRMYGLLWGTGNAADYGIRVNSGMTTIYNPANLPTVGPNVVNDVIVGTLAGLYATLPFTDLNRMAGFVPR